MTTSKRLLSVSLVLGAAALVAFGCGSEGSGAGPGGSSGSSGSSGNNNTSGGFGGDGGGNGNGEGGGGGNLQGCATSSKRAEKVPVDIGLALDTSFSMDFDQKWFNTKAALKAFVNNPAYEELGLALQFFPARKQCSIPDYAQPAVQVGLLPSIKGQVSSALDAQQMDLGTPIVQVLAGMTDYLRAYAATAPSRKPILLLATDGVPDDSCTGAGNENVPNTLENAVKKATDALSGKPSIPTFVIGVGTELTALDQIAAAGGTTKAILIDPTKNVQESFLVALETIRRNAIPCDYDIPTPESGRIDPAKVNVTYSEAEGKSETFSFVGTAAQCTTASNTGYYYDDPASPKKVTLCPQACDRVKANDVGTVNIVFGCARQDVR